MRSDHPIPRLTLNVPGLQSYLIDQQGSLWKHRGERSGLDKRLSSMTFTACMRRIGRKYSSFNLVPWPVIPGVWVMLHETRIPDDVPYLAHLRIDEFFCKHCFGSGREHLKGWPQWNEELHQAAANFDGEQSHMWHCLSDISHADWINELTPTPVAIWGPLAVLALKFAATPSLPRNG